MASDDTTKTKENIELAESVKAIMDAQWEAGASIAETLDKIIGKHGEIGKALKEQLGDMEKYATDTEKLQIVESQILETSQRKLDFMEELNRLEEKALRLAEEKAAALKEANKLTDKTARDKKKEEIRRSRYYKTSDRDLKRINELKQIGIDSSKAAIAAQKEIVQVTKDQNKETDKLVKAQTETEALMSHTLRTTLGLKDTTGDMADVLIDTLGTALSFRDAMQGAGKAMSQAFTKTRMLKSVKNHLSDIAATAWKNLTAMDGLQMKWEQMDSRLTQATGATKAFGAEAKQLSLTMLDQSFTIERTEAAYGNLYKSSKAFAQLTTEGRKALTEQALQFERIGVHADTFAASVDGLNKIFGDTPEEVNKTTEELSNFARAMGVGPNEMLAEFNKQLPLLARYGKEKGVKMFKELAATAKLAGLEMSELLNVAGQFDTFEGAAEAAGKLNFMLGGPMINSMEMLNATEEERIKMLRESVAASGKSFETMGRFEKDLIAKTLGVDVSVAQKLFSDQNLNNIEEAQAAFAGQANEMGSLASQAEKAKTLEEEKAANAQRSLKHTKELSETMKGIHKIMNQISGFFSEYGVFLLPVIGIFKMISWWIAFTSSQFGKSILTRLGLVKGAAAEEGIIHKMKLAADWVRTEIWYIKERTKEIAQNAWKKAVQGAQWAWNQMMRLKDWVAEKTMMNESRAGILAQAAWKKVTEGAQWAWKQVMRLKDWVAEKTMMNRQRIQTEAWYAWERTKEIAQDAWKKAKEGAQFAWKKVMRLKDSIAAGLALAKEKAAKAIFWAWEKVQFAAQWAWKKIGAIADAAVVLAALAAEKIAKAAFWAWEKIQLTAHWAWKKSGLLASAAVGTGVIAKDKVAKTGNWLWEQGKYGAHFLWIKAGLLATTLYGWMLLAKDKAIKIGSFLWEKGAFVAHWLFLKLGAIANAAVTAGAWIAGAIATGAAWVSAGLAIAAVWLANPITWIVLGIIAALALLWAFWEPIKEGFMFTLELIGDAFKWLGGLIIDIFVGAFNIVKTILKGFLNVIVWAIEGVMQAMFSPLTALIEGAAGILDWIPGMGSIADGLKSFSPGRIIHKYAGEIRAKIDSFAEGGTNVKGGPAIVGEKGPEMVTMGQGANVVTNENLQKSFSLSDRLAEKNNDDEPSMFDRLSTRHADADSGPSLWDKLNLSSEEQSEPAAAMAPPPAETGGGTTTINITLELDGEVLAKHTEEVAMGAMSKAFAFS